MALVDTLLLMGGAGGTLTGDTLREARGGCLMLRQTGSGLEIFSLFLATSFFNWVTVAIRDAMLAASAGQSWHFFGEAAIAFSRRV